MKEVDLELTLIRDQGNRGVRHTFQQNTGPKLIKMCNEKAKEVRKSAPTKVINYNMRNYGEKVTTKGG